MKLLDLLEEVTYDVDQDILNKWRDSWDIEKIIKATKKSKGYIKNLLKKNHKKGWQEL
jgi:hypothetical protein